MMKVSLFISILSGMLAGFVYKPWAPLEETPDGIKYQTVIELPGQCSKELYIKATKWFLAPNNYQLQFRQPEKGTLTGSGYGYCSRFYGLSYIPEVIHYTIYIEVKDDKLRCTFENILIRQQGSNKGKSLEEYAGSRYLKKDGSLRKTAEDIRENVVEALLHTAESLEETMQAEAMADNW